MSQSAIKKTIATAVVALASAVAVSACTVDTSTTSEGAGGTSVNASDVKAAGHKGPKYTVAQENAIESAENYLDMTGFSRAGLIQQLTSPAGDAFKRADAVFAVRHIKVNWKNEAVESAKSYLDMTGFSRAGLIQQLTSSAGDQYTRAQAEYAADQVGL